MSHGLCIFSWHSPNFSEMSTGLIKIIDTSIIESHELWDNKILLYIQTYPYKHLILHPILTISIETKMESMDTIAFFYLQSQEFSKWHIFFKKELADYIWKIHFPLFYYWILPDQTYNNCVTDCVTFYFILHNILSGGLFLIWNIILGQYFNIKFLPMLLYIFQMRWKKFNIKIYPWITLHIITFQPEKILQRK
jgi:hypothetical protein